MEPAGNRYWAVPAGEVLGGLASSAGGLAGDEAARRLAASGPNTVHARREDTALRQLLRQFRSPIVLILLGATAISAITKDWTDAAIILAIVFGSAALTFFQERRASRAVAQLRARLAIRVDVLRDGRSVKVPLEEVVPGDVVLLSAGSLVPADGLVLEANDFHVNQAVLTGETFPVDKEAGTVPEAATLAERTNCVFMGTNVRSGTARVLVAATGAQTEFGRIADRVAGRPPETGFERGLRRFGFLLSEVMMVLVLIVFAANVLFDKPALDSLLFSVALAVGITPQLLPAIVGITLSKGAHVMARKGVIVRRLEAIEDFGSLDVLCTDKTGTLTAGTVTLEAALDPSGEKSAETLRLAALNAHFETGISNPIDDAILAAAGDTLGGDAVKVDEVPYDFVRKRLSVVVDDAGKRRLITKGAFEGILEICTAAGAPDGSATPLDEAARARLHRRFEEASAAGQRVLGLAVKTVAPASKYSRDDEHGMTFAGFLLLADPVKPDAAETVAELGSLGIGLKVITGDNRLVAAALADAMGLSAPRILTGREIDDLPEEAMAHAAGEATIFAEVDPGQKERIILALKRRGHIVGYLGDGVNDAPALHSADVGISVDTAVDVAKEAADFVLLEHDLRVLCEGVRLGRRTTANTLKYVFMTTSANFGNMFSMAGVSLLLPFLPLLPVQILLINFLTDFPAMTIAGDRIDRELVDRPRRWNVAFIRKFMIVFGLVSSLFDYLTFAVLLLWLHASTAEFRSAWFVGSVITEVLVVFLIRTRMPFFRSRPGRGLFWTSMAVATAAVALPFAPFADVLGLVPLPARYLGVLAGIAVLYLVTTELVKRVFYRRSGA